MIRIILNSVSLALICWIMIYLLSFVWDGPSFYIFILLVGFVAPFFYPIQLIRGYLLNKKLSRLQVNFKSTIPCFAYLQMSQIRNDDMVIPLNSPTSLTYCLCLCSPEALYFYEAPLSALEKENFDFTICDDLEKHLFTLNKNQIVRFHFQNLGLKPEEKLQNFISNKISAFFQSYYKNTITTKIPMDALVTIQYKDADQNRLLTFGIPSTLSDSFSVSLIDLMPEIISQTNDYVSAPTEILEIFDDETESVKKAKNMIRQFLVELSKSKILSLSSKN